MKHRCQKIESPDLTIDLEKSLVDVNSAPVHLSPKELEILRVLVMQQEKPLTHKKLLQTVWGPDHADETEILRAVINTLRKKIERDPTHSRDILTEPWLGYRFEPPDTRQSKTSGQKL
jgi:two-component system KDP operon response regulator KdpE